MEILWRIAMPAVKPAWLTLAIFAFQRNWNATSSSYIYTETIKTLPTALSQITATGSVARAGEAYAASVLMLVPPIIFFILAQSSTVKTWPMRVLRVKGVEINEKKSENNPAVASHCYNVSHDGSSRACIHTL